MEEPEINVSTVAPEITGPCATRSANPVPLPDDPPQAFLDANFGGYWQREGDNSVSYSFGLVSPYRMMYRKSGIRGFGGIVPSTEDAVAPWTFRHGHGLAIVFVTTDCAELRETRGDEVSKEVIGVFTISVPKTT